MNWLLWACALLALAAPTMWASSPPPTSTFHHQILALLGWSAWCVGWVGAMALSPRSVVGGRASSSVDALWAVLAILAGAVGVSRGLPMSFVSSALGLLLAAALALGLAIEVARRGWAPPVFQMLCSAVALAALVGAVLGVIQVWAPEWPDGHFVAPSASGRASGNLRQPNHLSTLLLWGGVALVFLHAEPSLRPANPGRLRLCVALLKGLLLCFALMLSGSRTGVLGLLMLAAWGLMDGRLPRNVRLSLILSPIVYGLMAWGWASWFVPADPAVATAARLSLEGDVSASRFSIWANALTLIQQHPWTGVGWGQFNRAWTLTPLPNRPDSFFDNAHNLPLQLAVELGVPVAAVLCALLAWTLWRIARLAWGKAPEPGGLGLAASAMMVGLMALHSQLEYPLWYAYFLLPTVFLAGLSLAHDERPRSRWAEGVSRRLPSVALTGVAGLVAAASLCARADYRKVSEIFAPSDGAAPLAQRIEVGKQSLFFFHHAHYADATTGHGLMPDMEPFRVASYHLLDSRLIMAWSHAYAKHGDQERARFLADRLYEFSPSQAQPFQDACEAAREARQPEAFQCGHATQPLGLGDF